MNDRPYGNSVATIEFEEPGVPDDLLDEALEGLEGSIHEEFVDYIYTQKTLECGFKDSIAARLFLRLSASRALPHNRDFTITVDGQEIQTNGRCHGCDKTIVGSVQWSRWGKTCQQCARAC